MLLQKTVTFAKKILKKNAQIFKKYHKFGDQWHYFGKSRDTAHNIYILKQSLLKEITIVSYGSHNDYHFIITTLAEGFRGQFTKYKNTNKYQKRKKKWQKKHKPFSPNETRELIRKKKKKLN